MIHTPDQQQNEQIPKSKPEKTFKVTSEPIFPKDPFVCPKISGLTL